MDREIIFRKATLKDIPFIVDTIIEGEKSGTNRIGLANHFNLSENDIRMFLQQALEEEIEGCEWSLSSYIIADCEGMSVSTLAGWIEGQNEDRLPSSIVKANLVSCLLPANVIQASAANIPIVKGIQVDRKEGCYELEYSYTLPEFRGLHLNAQIILEHQKEAIVKGVSKLRMHTFNNNESTIRLYQNLGFKIVGTQKSNNPSTKEFYPSDELYIMEKQL